MGNRPEPFEHVLFELQMIKAAHVELSMRDGEMCPAERKQRQRIDGLFSFTDESKHRKELGTLIEKGGDVSAYMNRKAAPLKMRIVHLDDHRACNVSEFRPRDDNHAS